MPLGGSSTGGTSANAIKAGEAYVEITGKNQLSGMLDDIAGRFTKVGGTIAKVGAGIAGAGIAALTPLMAIFNQALDEGDKATKAAERLNSTAVAAQRLGYAAEQSDASLEDMVKANTLLTKAAIAATEGQEKQAAAFAKMGIGAEEFLALEADDRILFLASAFENMNSDVEKSEFLFTLLGKSAVTLLPLLKSGSDGLKNLFEYSDKFNITNEDAAKATAAGDAIADVYRAIKMTILEVGFALVGLDGEMRANADTVVGYLAGVRQWMMDNRHVVLTITGISVALVALGAGMVATGGVAIGLGLSFTALSIVFKMVTATATAMWSAIFAPATIGVAAVAVAVGALTYAFLEHTEAGENMKISARSMWGEMVADAEQGIEGIASALKQGKIETAWKILLGTIKGIWLELRAFLVEQRHMVERNTIDVVKQSIAGWEIAYQWIKAKTTGGDARAAAKKVVDDFNNEMERIGFARNKELAEVERQRELQKWENWKLIQGLNPAAGPMGPETAPMPRLSSSMGQALATLGEAVKGTFASSNYGASLGLGPANTAAQQQLKETKKIREVLQNIEKKIAVPEFE